ncbi:MAG: hypothetical protein KGN16_24810 [Burkholderiales bacterium]|nr:hypothetical protein [Burkholderiales bacterium]
MTAERFEREYGATESEWFRGLTGAVAAAALRRPASGRAEVALGAGRLHLDWTVLTPRRIALMEMPRMTVRFRFEDVDEGERIAFMRSFDLHLHRGGG